jgi:hypothetical protein
MQRPHRAADAGSVRDLLHRGRISNRGLCELLKVLRDKNIDMESAARQGTVNAAFLQRATQIGITSRMPMTDGGEFPWFYLDPNALVATIVEGSSELQRIFWEV